MADDAGEDKSYLMTIQTVDPISREQKAAFKAAIQDVLDMYGAQILEDGK